MIEREGRMKGEIKGVKKKIPQSYQSWNTNGGVKPDTALYKLVNRK